MIIITLNIFGVKLQKKISMIKYLILFKRKQNEVDIHKLED
jgi:hypothetical protein